MRERVCWPLVPTLLQKLFQMGTQLYVVILISRIKITVFKSRFVLSGVPISDSERGKECVSIGCKIMFFSCSSQKKCFGQYL